MNINLTEICKASKWHLATAIEATVAAGATQQDADAVTGFVFNDHAKITDCAAEDLITDEQYDDLSLSGMDWIYNT